MSEKLLAGLVVALMAVILPAFATVLPREAVPQPTKPFKLAALHLSAPQTIAAAPSPRLPARADDDGLPPVEITGPAR